MPPTLFSPLGVGGVLRASAVTYRQRFRTLVATATVLDLPYAILYFVLAPDVPTLSPVPSNAEMSEFLRVMGPWVFVRLLITAVLLAAAVRVVAESYTGSRSSWLEIAATAINRMVALSVVTVLYWSGVMLGIALFVLPGLFIAVAWSVTLGALMVEGRRPLAAIVRSMRITAGRRLAIFGVLATSSALLIVANLVLLVALGVLLGSLFGEVGTFLAAEAIWITTQPAVGVVLALLYLDLRVRKEELDVARLAEELSATSFDR